MMMSTREVFDRHMSREPDRDLDKILTPTTPRTSSSGSAAHWLAGLDRCSVARRRVPAGPGRAVSRDRSDAFSDSSGPSLDG
jgi:hypothetical protein